MPSTFFLPSCPPNPLAKPGYILEFIDEFDAPVLDGGRWIAAHLPQWSSRRQAAARHGFDGGHLALRIDADQPPWCPEFDGDIRVSSLQTGVASGPLGSSEGQHRFQDGCRVREAQPRQLLYAPTYGYFEVRARAEIGAGQHVAFWMIGCEDLPEQSGEICIFEIFGKELAPGRACIRHGVHPFGDPRLQDDFRVAELAMDVSDFHVYAAEWTPSHIDFFVDNRRLGRVAQSPSYPMQFMLGIYERPAEIDAARPPRYPSRFEVDHVRAYQPVNGHEGEAT